MGVRAKPTGLSQEGTLLWEILKKLDDIKVYGIPAFTISTTTSTTTTTTTV